MLLRAKEKQEGPEEAERTENFLRTRLLVPQSRFIAISAPVCWNRRTKNAFATNLHAVASRSNVSWQFRLNTKA